jgi:hypothetical protein
MKTRIKSEAITWLAFIRVHFAVVFASLNMTFSLGI